MKNEDDEGTSAREGGATSHPWRFGSFLPGLRKRRGLLVVVINRSGDLKGRDKVLDQTPPWHVLGCIYIYKKKISSNKQTNISCIHLARGPLSELL